MGLLDDAIREHLELKRRRGADPGEVAREQRDALDPVEREAIAEREEDAALDGEQPAAPGMDETAELDMRTVLGEDPARIGEDAAPGGAHPTPAAGAPSAGEDSLEWEMPGAADAKLAVEPPGEDVLEETPDFLRDTPEQDKLWFEQRPPRDFDFDK